MRPIHGTAWAARAGTSWAVRPQWINGELVRGGFARAKPYAPNTRYKADLKALEAEAKAAGRGLWGACADAAPTAGKGFDPARPAAVVSSTAKSAGARPPRTPAERKQQQQAEALQNPGDVKNCADFATYEEAKAWFDRYYPAFGDVAKLDGNGDGRPCESLPQRRRG